MRRFATSLALAAALCARAAGADEPLPSEAKEQDPRALTEEAATFPLRVDAIRIEGLVRTKPHVVRRELGFSEGDVVTKDDFDLAVTRLWNTTIFARVHGEVERSGGKNVVVIVVEDRWTLNPLFRFQTGGDTFFFRIGAADNNVLGRFLEVAAQYEYFDGFHGGQALFRDPRLFGRRMGLLVLVDRLVRPRWGFSDQRTQLVTELAHLFDRDRVAVGMRVSAFANRFLDPLEGPRFFPSPTETLLLEPAFRLGRIDMVRIRQRGASVELRPGVGFTTSDVADTYGTMTGEALGFVMLGERWNLAARVRAANVTRVPAHLELYAGGLDLVRGFPDNYVRTRAFTLANAEVRFTAFDSTWIALVPTVFADAIAARSPQGPTGTALSVGGGVRVLVPKFVGTGLRVDFAVPVHADFPVVTEPEQGRFGPVTPVADVGSLQPSFGVYQFF